MTGQILEVKDVDPMLDVSHLTEDSRTRALQEGKGEKSSLGVTMPRKNQSPLTRFATPKKVRAAGPDASTPDTAPMDDDDTVCHGSKYNQHTETAVTIRVDDYKVLTFEKLVRRLDRNSNLETVEIYRLRDVSSKRTRTHEEIAHFFTMLRGLPNLKTLILKNFNGQDLSLISFMIRGHKTLEKIHIHLTSSTVASAFLDVLSEAPVLNEVLLDVHASFPLHLLMASQTLTRITVPSQTFHFEEHHLVFAMNALEKNKTLRILDLKPLLTASDIRLLSFGIKENSTLQVLRFSFVAEEEEAGAALLHLCGALAKNPALEIVENYFASLLRVKPGDAYRIRRLGKSVKTLEVFNKEQGELDETSSDDSDFLATLMCHPDVSISFLSDQARRCFRPNIDDPCVQLSQQPQGRRNIAFSAITSTSDRLRTSFAKWRNALKA